VEIKVKPARAGAGIYLLRRDPGYLTMTAPASKDPEFKSI